MTAGSPLDPSAARDIGGRVAVIVLAGVSGSGKSTIGGVLQQVLGWPYSEADAFHPRANIEKMSSGIALTDEDRAPWLAAIAAYIDDIVARGDHGIVSCSALKRAYRETLVGAHRDKVRIVLLDGSEAELAARLAARKGHFMPPSLLRSQIATLERPGDDEHAIVVPIRDGVDAIVANIVAALRE